MQLPVALEQLTSRFSIPSAVLLLLLYLVCLQRSRCPWTLVASSCTSCHELLCHYYVSACVSYWKNKRMGHVRPVFTHGIVHFVRLPEQVFLRKQQTLYELETLKQ